MKRRSMHWAVLMAVLLVIVNGCASIHGRFEQAGQANTIEAYETFIRENPKSPLVNEARARIEALRFQDAKRANTIKAYEDFLRQHPGSRYTAEAQTQLEPLYFQQAQQRNTPEAFKDFLSKYPRSQYAPEAQAQLEAFGFQRAKQANTIKAWEDFLKEFPRSRYAAEAQTQLEPLYFQQAQQRNTAKAFKDFLSKYPQGQYAAEAQAQLAAFGFQDAKRLNTIKAWEDFLKEFPGSRYVSEAQGQLELQYFQQAKKSNDIEGYQEYLKRYPKGRFASESQAQIKALGAPTPYVVYFYFAPERCEHCRAMAPIMQRFYREYGIASKRGPGPPRAFLDRPPIRLVAFGPDLLWPRFVQIPGSEPESKQQKFEVYGVPIRGWGDPDVFKRNHNITFPIIPDPGLSVDTSSHPVTVVHNKQTHMTRVAAVGEVAYTDIVAQTTRFAKGEDISTRRIRGAT